MAIGIGVLGAGTVGATLIRRLVDDHAAILTKTGLDLRVVKVAVRDTTRSRGLGLEPGVITDRLIDVVDDPGVDLVVELMGGKDAALEAVRRSLAIGKPVVSANKELIAAHGPELLATAEETGVPLLFEAAVGGGIPIIRPLSETLAGEPIRRVLGIVNGTTNFILTRMTEDGADFAAALAEAQSLGFAEADPTADVSGADAAAKAAILASLAFGTWVGPDQVFREGIEGLAVVDIEFAAGLGYVVKLLAVAEHTGIGVSARVHPVLVPIEHPLAAVRGATNAVFVTGAGIGELLFAGPGAGGAPTASAVLGDIIDAAREILADAKVSPRIRFSPGEIVDFAEIPTCWYVRLEVIDRPGVLAQVATAFAGHEVSIRSVWQEGRGDAATLLLITHAAPEARQRAAISELRGLDAVREVAAVIRVEEESE
jgi:homoserine dehydrogenase